MITPKHRFGPAIEPQLPVVLSPFDGHSLTSETTIEGALVTEIDVTVGQNQDEDEVEYLEISGSRLAGLRLTASSFNQLRLTDVVVEDCELSGISLLETSFLRVRFSRCRLSGFTAHNLKARDVTFEDCKIDNANFRMTSWERTRFSDCDLSGSDFSSSQLSAFQFLRSNLDLVVLSNCKLQQVSLHGSKVDSIRGADALRGAVIGSDQVLPLALPVFTALGIDIDDLD